jgi:hypothetical protein
MEKLSSVFNRQLSAAKSSIHTAGAGKHLFNPPPLSRTQRTRFDYAHAIADLAGSGFIMRQKFRGLPLDLFVEGVLHQSINGNRNRLLHSRTGYGAHLAFANSPFLFSVHLCLNGSKFNISDPRLKTNIPESGTLNFELFISVPFPLIV